MRDRTPFRGRRGSLPGPPASAAPARPGRRAGPGAGRRPARAEGEEPRRHEQEDRQVGQGPGLDQQDPAWADPLGALAEKAHLGKGVNRDGDLAIAMLDPAQPARATATRPSSSWSRPATTRRSCRTSRPRPTRAAASTRPARRRGRTTVYVANWGQYAAVSPAKAMLTKKPAGAEAQRVLRQGGSRQGRPAVRQHEGAQGQAAPAAQGRPRAGLGGMIEQGLRRRSARTPRSTSRWPRPPPARC